MASFLGETIIQPSDLSIAYRLHQDSEKKDEEGEKVLVEDLKEELKTKHRESYRLYAEMCRMIYEWNKMDFSRTMDRAWLTNQIIRERSERCDLSDDLWTKAGVFNRQIVAMISLGLDGIMFGPSKKRRASSVEKEEEASDEELEELRDLKSLHEEAVLQIVEADRDEMREKCKDIYRCARPFAKRAAREEYLSSVVKALLEREREREKRPAIPTTEIEILGCMLLEEMITSTLQHPYIHFTPYATPVPVTPKLEKSRNSMTLASIRGGGVEPPKIQVDIAHPTLYTLSGKWSFEELVAADYASLLTKAKSAGNHSEMEQVKWVLEKVEEKIKTGEEGCQDIFPKVLRQMAAVRSFESRLVVYCEDLPFLSYGRCLNPLSPTETKELEEIRVLARNAIDKYREANGPDSLPLITQPVLPSFRTTM